MKLATIQYGGGFRAARLQGEELVVLPQSDAAGALVSREGNSDGPRVALADAKFAQPSLVPGKIACIGLNYSSHIGEMGREHSKRPPAFAKYADALVGPYDPIELPEVSSEMDWEAELALFIAEPIRFAGLNEARNAIGGFTVMNDVTARDSYLRSLFLGKTFEHTTPIGPFIVTPDELDFAQDLEIRCEVDGEVVQRARTSEMILSPAAIVSAISEVCTLWPGDIISTGTPAGVGASRNPKVFLENGQLLRTEIEGIGYLANECRRFSVSEMSAAPGS